MVTLTSNENLKDNLISDGWELSEDKKVYTKTLYEKNCTYNIVLKDEWNNKTNKIISTAYTGIDVSQHQDKINWEEVKKTGIDFVILRLGWIGNKENHKLDTYFNENYETCKRLGIPVGVYVYSYCESEETVKEGAEWVVEQLKEKTFNYPVYIDMEDDQIAGLDKETLTNISKTFCEQLKSAGYSKVGVYANLNWWNNKLNYIKLKNYDNWIAQYGKNNDGIVDDICKYNGKYNIWQYTSNGSVNGIIGRVDMNYCYKSY